MATPLERLVELGLTLPEAAAPVANYVPYVRTGELLFVSGNVSRNADGSVMPGKLGADMTVEEGYVAARSAAMYVLAAANEAAGSLDGVKRVVRMLGMVNCTPDFAQMSQVINGASDLFVDIFGDAGRHSRAAVGMASLPANSAVEIEVICELR